MLHCCVIKIGNSCQRGDIDNGKMAGITLKEWRDVVYPWHLLDANEETLKGIKGKVEGTVEENVILKGPIFIGKGTKVMITAVVHI